MHDLCQYCPSEFSDGDDSAFRRHHEHHESADRREHRLFHHSGHHSLGNQPKKSGQYDDVHYHHGNHGSIHSHAHKSHHSIKPSDEKSLDSALQNVDGNYEVYSPAEMKEEASKYGEYKYDASKLSVETDGMSSDFLSRIIFVYWWAVAQVGRKLMVKSRYHGLFFSIKTKTKPTKIEILKIWPPEWELSMTTWSWCCLCCYWRAFISISSISFHFIWAQRLITLKWLTKKGFLQPQVNPWTYVIIHSSVTGESVTSLSPPSPPLPTITSTTQLSESLYFSHRLAPFNFCVVRTVQ